MRTASGSRAARFWFASALMVLGSITAFGVARAATAWLGVYTQTLTSELREGLDYQGEGVLISGVVAGSPASEAGLRKGDVITRLDGQRIESSDEFVRTIQSSRVGDEIELRAIRNGTSRTVRVRLGDRDDRRGEERDEIRVPVPPTPPVPPVPEIQRHRDDGDRDRAERERDDDSARDDEGDVDDVPGTPAPSLLGRGRLGVRVEGLESGSGLGNYFRVPEGRGVLVVDVVDDSPASRAGIEEGDVITRIGDERVGDVEELMRAIRESDSRVTLTIYRNGSRRTVEAELDAAPPGLRLPPHGTTVWRDRDGDVRMRRLGGGSQSNEELRREVQQLREEIKRLRRELEDMKRD